MRNVLVDLYQLLFMSKSSPIEHIFTWDLYKYLVKNVQKEVNDILDHLMIYSTCCSDTFDENTPPVDDPHFISSLGAAIFQGMQSGDSNAVWLMQVDK